MKQSSLIHKGPAGAGLLLFKCVSDKIVINKSVVGPLHGWYTRPARETKGEQYTYCRMRILSDRYPKEYVL
jgi:hypothetical protein